MDICEYLISLPKITKNKLLNQPHCCLAIFKSLPSTDRFLVTRLLTSPCHSKSLCPKLIPSSTKSNEHQKTQSDSSSGENTAEAWNVQTKSSQKSAYPYGSQETLASDQTLFSQLVLPDLWRLGVLEWTNGLIELEEGFRQSLHSAISTPNHSLIPIETQQIAQTNPIDETELSTESLIEFAKSKWEDLVVPLLGLAHPNHSFPQSHNFSKLARIFFQAGLTDEDCTLLQPDGFTFLLSDIPKQVWTLANSFIAKELSVQHRADAIGFLVFLATTLVSGKLYCSDNLNDVQKRLLEYWEMFGLIRFPASQKKRSNSKKNQNYFTPTPLVAQIVGSPSIENSSAIGNWASGIIVESNFYLYLYTNSSIMISLLEIFSEIVCRLPNMCVARLTRKSVRNAFKKGIHAQHIIHYLRSNKHHAHVKAQHAAAVADSIHQRSSNVVLAKALATGNETDDMFASLTSSSGLPEQVEDQLLLWEEERFRFESFHVIWWEFEEGIDEPDWYNQVKTYATDINALVWSNDKSKSLCVKKEAQETMVSYYRSLQSVKMNK